MFLHDWKPNFTLKEDVIRVMSIWVNFHQLPLIYYGEQSIGKITSVVGKPIMTDECTTKKFRVSYAKMLIEEDINNKFERLHYY